VQFLQAFLVLPTSQSSTAQAYWFIYGNAKQGEGGEDGEAAEFPKVTKLRRVSMTIVFDSCLYLTEW
jgi:hypothetical protein